MDFNDEEIDIIKDTWDAVLYPEYPEEGFNPVLNFSTKFYRRVFEHENCKNLFEEVDMTSQGEKLVKILSVLLVAVQTKSLNQDHIHVLRKMGERHRGYGVSDDMYEIIGGCLLRTLSEVCADVWDDDAKVVWAKLFGVVSEQMKLQ